MCVCVCNDQPSNMKLSNRGTILPPKPLDSHMLKLNCNLWLEEYVKPFGLTGENWSLKNY